MAHPSAASATASTSSTAAHGHVLSADGLLDVDVTASKLVVALKSETVNISDSIGNNHDKES